MKKTLYILLPLLLLAFFADDAYGQRSKRKRLKQRFHAGLLAGFNLSQIDGDLYTGFDKVNVQAGIFGTARFSHRTELVIELMYVGKGSKVGNYSLRRNSEVLDNSLTLHYVEAPILLRHKFNEDVKGYYLEAGFAYARLANYKIDQVPSNELGVYFEDYALDFERNEFSLLGGLGYQFSEHFCMKFRTSFSLTKFFERELDEQMLITGTRAKLTVTQLRNYRIGFSGVYYF